MSRVINQNLFINKSEITQDELDSLVKNYDWEVFEMNKMSSFLKTQQNLLHKGETGIITEEDFEFLQKAKELNFRVIQIVSPDWTKRTVFLKKVNLDDIDLEKGVYVDNSMNRKLGRVGRQYGKKKEGLMV